MKSKVFILVLLLAGAARADELSAAARSLDQSLEAVEQEIAAAREKAGDAYLKLLKRAAGRFKAGGDLEGAVAVRREIKRFTAERSVPPPTRDWPPLLDQCRLHYQGLLARVKQARRVNVDKAFHAHADQLKIRATRLVNEDKLDEAVSVDEYLRTLSGKKAKLLGEASAPDPAGTPPVQPDRIATVKRAGSAQRIEVSDPGPVTAGAVKESGHEIVLWNCPGAQAVSTCTLRLKLQGAEVWSSIGQRMESSPDKVTRNRFPLPDLKFDQLRIELSSVSRRGSGLTEVEVMRGGRNIALKQPVRDNKSSIETYPPKTLTDGRTRGGGPGTHWRAYPIQNAAWIEIGLNALRPGPLAGRPRRPAPAKPRPALALSTSENRDIRKAMVTIHSEDRKGAGFIGRKNGRLHIYTNQHLILGAKNLRLVTHGGKTLKPLQLEVATRQDLARIRFDTSKLDGEVMALQLARDTPKIDETVSVYGNAIASARKDGKLLAVGPEVVEVDAAFKSEHSGSPILNRDLEVLGVATYVVRRNARNWITEGTRFSQVRRFGVRAGDGITWRNASFDQYAKQGNLLSDAGKYMQELVVTINQLIYANYGNSKSVTYINGNYNMEKAKARYHDPEWAQSMNDLYRQFGAHVSKKRVSQSDVDRVDRVLKNEIASRASKVVKLMEHQRWSHEWFKQEGDNVAGMARNLEEQIGIIFDKKMRLN